jgi:hypothetical protein
MKATSLMTKRTRPRSTRITPAVVAEKLRIDPSTVRIWASQGILQAESDVDTAGRVRLTFDPAEIDTFARELELSEARATDEGMRWVNSEIEAAFGRWRMTLNLFNLHRDITRLAKASADIRGDKA